MKLYLVISTKVHVLVHFYLRMRQEEDPLVRQEIFDKVASVPMGKSKQRAGKKPLWSRASTRCWCRVLDIAAKKTWWLWRM